MKWENYQHRVMIQNFDSSLRLMETNELKPVYIKSWNSDIIIVQNEIKWNEMTLFSNR